MPAKETPEHLMNARRYCLVSGHHALNKIFMKIMCLFQAVFSWSGLWGANEKYVGFRRDYVPTVVNFSKLVSISVLALRLLAGLSVCCLPNFV